VGDAVRVGLVASTRVAPTEASRPIDWVKARRLYVSDGLSYPKLPSAWVSAVAD